MQKPDPSLEFTVITQTAQINAQSHGWRAKCLQRLVRLDLPVPLTVALPAKTVRAIAGGPRSMPRRSWTISGLTR